MSCVQNQQRILLYPATAQTSNLVQKLARQPVAAQIGREPVLGFLE
jgi:hypothetical protein